MHEYVHYYQHFATLYGSQFCKMANLLFIETRAFLEGADKVVIPFGIWEHNEGISRYRNRVKAVCGSKNCGHIVGDVEIDRREIRIAEEEKKPNFKSKVVALHKPSEKKPTGSHSLCDLNRRLSGQITFVFSIFF